MYISRDTVRCNFINTERNKIAKHELSYGEAMRMSGLHVVHESG